MYSVKLSIWRKGNEQVAWDTEDAELSDGLLKMWNYGPIGELVEITVNLKDEKLFTLIITKTTLTEESKG